LNNNYYEKRWIFGRIRAKRMGCIFLPCAVTHEDYVSVTAYNGSWLLGSEWWSDIDFKDNTTSNL